MRHTLATRWFHWSQATILIVLMASGLVIYWPLSLPNGIAYHFVAAWFFMLNGLGYLIYFMVSGRWRQLAPSKSSFKEAGEEFARDLKGLPPKTSYHESYSHSQRLVYSGVLMMQIFAMLTGLAIWKPVEFKWVTAAFGGYTQARQFHYLIWYGFQAFLLIHVGQAARAGWKTVRAMIVGRNRSQ